MDLGQFQ